MKQTDLFCEKACSWPSGTSCDLGGAKCTHFPALTIAVSFFISSFQIPTTVKLPRHIKEKQ